MDDSPTKESVEDDQVTSPQTPSVAADEQIETVKEETEATTKDKIKRESSVTKDESTKSDNNDPLKTDAQQMVEKSSSIQLEEQGKFPNVPPVEPFLSNETNEGSVPSKPSEITAPVVTACIRERLDSAPTDTTGLDYSTPRPKPIDNASSRTESAPVTSSTGPVPPTPPTESDAGSIGSIPSAIDSLAGIPFLSPAGEPVKVVSATPSQLASAEVKMQDETHHEASKVPTERLDQQPTAMMADAQPTQQTPPVLVAVPQQPQQTTLYYQVPQMASVVTVPSSAPNAVTQTFQQQQADDLPAAQAQQISGQQSLATTQPVALSQAHVPVQNGDQVIGMVGAIPVLKIPGSSLHYVKKKKGRFNLLQEAPAAPTAGFAPAPSATVTSVPVVSFEDQGQQTQSAATTAAALTNGTNSAPIPNNITVPTRSQSPLSGVSHVSTAVSVPQTFDGRSAPTVRKKGRFTVTNVRNPGSIPGQKGQAKSQGTTPITAPQSETGTVQPHQELWQQNPQASQYQQSTVVSEQMYHQVPLHPLMIQPITTMQATYDNTTHIQTYAQSPYAQQFYQDANGQFSLAPPIQPPLDGQQHYIQAHAGTVHHIAGTHAQLVYTPQTSHVAPQPQQLGSIGQEHVSINPSTPHNQNVLLDIVSLPAHVPGPSAPSPSMNVTTPPPTPGGAQLSQQVLPRSDTSPNHAAQSMNPALPSAQVPRPPSGANAAAKASSVPKKKILVQGKAGKVPQTIDKDGTWSSVGLGKVFYFLDQMKMEVTEADRCIKTLQTDMKLLRDKNKELEAKNRELDRKLREEKGLREKVEARNADLRKKLREAKGEPPRPPDKASTLNDNDAPRLCAEAVTSVDKGKQGIGGPNETYLATSTPSSTPTKPVQSSAAKPSTLASPSVHSITSDETKKAGSLSNKLKAQEQVKIFERGNIPILHDDGIGKAKAFLPDGVQKNTASETQPSKSTPQSVTTTGTGSAPPPKALAPSQGKVVPMKLQNMPTKANPVHGQTNEVKEGNDQSSGINHTVNGNDIEGENKALKETNTTKPNPLAAQSTAIHTANVTSLSGSTPVAPAVQQPQNELHQVPTHRSTRSLHDFDPLSSHNHHSSSSDTMLPVVSLPTSYSLGAVPINSGHSDVNGTFMSPNPFMVPVAFEMGAPAAAAPPSLGHDSHPHHVANGHTVMATGFQGFQQQQQFMVVSQQQPVMFQQIGNDIHQVSEHSNAQWGQQQVPVSNQQQQHQLGNYPQPNTSGVLLPQSNLQQQPHQYPPSLQHQGQQPQHQASHPHQQNASNPFDPFSSR
jgi:hypothetical protein